MGDFYCSVCNVRRVERDGDVCPSCQDPYQTAVQVPFQPQQPSVQQESVSVNEPQYKDDQPVIIHRSNRKIMGPASQTASSAPTGRAVIQHSAPQQANSTKLSNSTTVPVANPQQPVQGSASAKNNANPWQTEGIVRNIQESKDNTPVLARWMRSFTYGVPFPLTNDMIEFQVFSGWNSSGSNSSGPSADKVIAYGTINSGKPIQDNSVRVYGTRARNNAIIASDIENTTDGTYAEFNPPPLSALAVRIITFLVLGIILFLFIGAFRGVRGMTSGDVNISAGISNFITNAVLTIIGGLGILFCFSQMKQAFSTRQWGKVFEFALFTLFALALTISFAKSMIGM